jgi:hypothetical protein
MGLGSYVDSDRKIAGETMSDLMRFLFKGKMPEVVRIRVIKADSGRQAPVPSEEYIRFRLVSFFSWILALTLVISLIGMFVLLLTKNAIPAFLPPVITAVIGYFGGAIAAYFGVRST